MGNYNTGWNREGLAKAFSFALPTEIVFGPGCVERLAQTLEGLGCRAPLVVTDPGVRKAGIVERALRPLGGAYAVFDGVEANPKDTNVAAAARAYRDARADGIVAIGGGSPIDCAKAAGVLLANGADDIKPFEGRSQGKPIPPLVAIPTTAGTGSELTFSSVITDTKNRYKMTIKTAYTAPRVAICDPRLTVSVPPSVTASTGMDALTHALEAFTATCSEPIADAVALYAMELIYANLEAAVRNGDDLDARAAMLMGSMLGGIAFSHSDVASVHCVAEALGGLYDLPHGLCNAVILPHMMEYNMRYCEARYARAADAMGVPRYETGEGASASPSQRAADAVRAVRELAAAVGLPPFTDLHVKPEDFPAIAAASARNLSTPSNPRPMDEAAYLDLLRIMSAA